MSIKTLHLTNAYHPCSGGIRTFYRALLDAANRHRRFVRLVVPGEEDFVEEVGEFGRIYHVASPRSPILDSRYRLMLPHMYAWPYESRLRSILALEKPDLIEVCDKLLLCYLPGVLRRGWIPHLRVPAMVGLSCERLDDTVSSFLSDSPALHSLAKFYIRRLYIPRFDFHIAISEYVAEELRSVCPERFQDRLQVAPMGVDYEWFSRDDESAPLRNMISAKLGAPANAVFLLYAGRLSKEKNLLLLPQMFAHLVKSAIWDFRLVVAGSGPLEDELRRKLEQCAPGRSVFLGHQDRSALARLLRATDVFVHPNPREPFGIVPLEAMSAGLPVVAPSAGGVLTYANHTNAWLASPDGQSFAAAVLAVLHQTDERARRIESARQTAREHSWIHITARYFRLYDAFRCRFEREQRSRSIRRHGHLFDPKAA